MVRSTIHKLRSLLSSIRAKMLVGLGASVFFTSIAAWVAVDSFQAVDHHTKLIIEKQAPALVSSIKLSLRLSDLVAHVPNLVRAKSIDEIDDELAVLDKKKEALTEEIDNVDELITKQYNEEDQRLNVLKQISSSSELLLMNVDSLEKVVATEVGFRVEISELMQKLLTDQEKFSSLLQPLITASQLDEKRLVNSQIQVMLELKSDITQLSKNIMTIADLADIESLTAARREIESLFDRIFYRIELLKNSAAKAELLKIALTIKEVTLAHNKGLFSKAERMLYYQAQTNEFLQANKQFSGKLEALTNQFTALQNSYSAIELKKARSSIVGAQVQLLILVAMSFLISIALSWLFLGPWVGRRLVKITQFLTSITQGNLDNKITVIFEDELGQVERGLQLFQETIKARREVESELIRMAEYDALTGLPNRHLLHNKIEQAINLSQRNNLLFAVMFIDLDKFKIVNDSQGHHVGDQLLTHVAKRLISVVRKSDTVGRLGGDEFAVLAMLSKDDDIRALSEKILKQMNQPVLMNGQEYYVGASIGITLYPRDGNDPATLLRKADTAMYMAKELGGGHLQFFAEEMNERTALRFELQHQLQQALQNKEFQLFYQPQVKFDTHEIVGVEALIRWQRPDGFMPPNRFIAVAEEIGIIEDLSEWVLDKACHDCQIWRRAGYDVPVSVNVSSKQLVNTERFERALQTVLKRNNLPAAYLLLEVTESAVMDDLGRSSELLKKLRRIGHKIALDDFGTGYSSLNHLRSLPIDELKIDKSFIDNIAFSPIDIALTRAIVDLGEQLGMSIVFEGVETADQRRTLSLTGSHVYQGYHFSKPLPLDDLIRLFGSQISNEIVI